MLAVDTSKRSSFARFIADCDLIIVYERNDAMKAVNVGDGSAFQNRFGVFEHTKWIGNPSGQRCYSNKGLWLLQGTFTRSIFTSRGLRRPGEILKNRCKYRGHCWGTGYSGRGISRGIHWLEATEVGSFPWPMTLRSTMTGHPRTASDPPVQVHKRLGDGSDRDRVQVMQIHAASRPSYPTLATPCTVSTTPAPSTSGVSGHCLKGQCMIVKVLTSDEFQTSGLSGSRSSASDFTPFWALKLASVVPLVLSCIF